MKAKFFILLFVVMAGASFLGTFLADPDASQLASASLAASMVPFEVRQGESASLIAERLLAEKIISSKFMFIGYATLTGAVKNLKPGQYSFSPGKVTEIVRELTKGPRDVTVVLFPGMTVSEMDKKLSEAGIIHRHELEKLSADGSLEGYLMPDTYHFSKNTGAETVARVMRENFDEKTKDLFKTMDEGDVQQVVTIASLIEKEVAQLDDRKIVSGIIYRRLYDSYPLQIDASVAYGACEGVFIACETFGGDSFKKDTPFNTYTRAGLPPHPISNPSVDAIDAALHPTQTDYYFYLTDRSTGDTHFSKTFEEHSAKREKYF